MRLTELDAELITTIGEDHGWRRVSTMAEAQGVAFDSPTGGGRRIAIWFQSPPTAPAFELETCRWGMTGTGLHDLTLNPSVFIRPSGGPGSWHGWIRNGEVVNA